MTSSRLSVNFSRIISQVICSPTFLSPNKINVSIPGGFPYEAFNPRACVTPWSLSKMAECAHSASYSVNFLDASELYKNYFMFLVATSTSVSPKLYDMTSVKGPLVHDITLNYIGTTSFRLKGATHIVGNAEPMFKTDVQTVLLDINTRKPAPPPDWWIQKHSLCASNGEPLKLKHLDPPSGVKVYENHLEVPASDVDSYLHVNWSNYIKYFYESYVKSELKKDNSGDPRILFRNLKEFSVSYIQEATIGDKLKIRYWENENTKDIFHFQLLKHQEILTESSIELFPIT